jgi:hypothetical protein
MPEVATPVRETGCYVYAVVPVGADVTGILGVDDRDVRLVEAGEVAVVVSDLDLDRPPARRKELLAHSRVVDALAAAGPVVPVRFGSVVLDDAAAVEDTVADDPDLADLLRRLATVVQLNLRATYAEEHVLAEVVESDPVVADLRERTRDLPPGTMHPDLVRLGERVSHALDGMREHDRAHLLEQVTPLAEAVNARPTGGTDGLLDAALLIDREHLVAVEERLEELAEAVHPRVRLRLVGPVPPYDFVEDRSWV